MYQLKPSLLEIARWVKSEISSIHSLGNPSGSAVTGLFPSSSIPYSGATSGAASNPWFGQGAPPVRAPASGPSPTPSLAPSQPGSRSGKQGLVISEGSIEKEVEELCGGKSADELREMLKDKDWLSQTYARKIK